jgi:structural maintenance of chromosome 4
MNAVQRLQAEASQADALQRESLERRKELSNEVRQLEQRIKQLKVLVPKLKLEIDGCDTTRDHLTKLIPELIAQCKLSVEDQEHLVELEGIVAKCKADLLCCEKNSSELEAEVAELQKSILDAGGPKLKKQQKACEETLEALSLAEKELTVTTVLISSVRKAAEKATAAREAASTQLEALEKSLVEKQAEFASLEKDALRVHSAYEAVKILEAEKRQGLEGVAKECTKLKKSQAEIKCLEVELLGNFESIEKQVQDASQKRKHWENELRKLCVKADEEDIDDELLDNECMEEVEEQDRDASNAQESDSKPKDSVSSLPTLSVVALANYSKDEIKAEISLLESERSNMAKNTNMGAIAEYRKKEADYLQR